MIKYNYFTQEWYEDKPTRNYSEFISFSDIYGKRTTNEIEEIKERWKVRKYKRNLKQLLPESQKTNKPRRI